MATYIRQIWCGFLRVCAKNVAGWVFWGGVKNPAWVSLLDFLRAPWSFVSRPAGWSADNALSLRGANHNHGPLGLRHAAEARPRAHGRHDGLTCRRSKHRLPPGVRGRRGGRTMHV